MNHIHTPPLPQKNICDLAASRASDHNRSATAPTMPGDNSTSPTQTQDEVLPNTSLPCARSARYLRGLMSQTDTCRAVTGALDCGSQIALMIAGGPLSSAHRCTATGLSGTAFHTWMRPYLGEPFVNIRPKMLMGYTPGSSDIEREALWDSASSAGSWMEGEIEGDLPNPNAPGGEVEVAMRELGRKARCRIPARGPFRDARCLTIFGPT